MSDRKRDKKFIQAAGDGNLSELANLLADGADIKAVGGFWQMHTTALSFAAVMDKPAAMRWLLNNGADINQRDTSGSTALIHAVINSNYRCVSLLLDAGANMYIGDSGGRTPRQHVPRGRGRAIGLLLDSHDKALRAATKEKAAPAPQAAPAGEDPDVVILRQQIGNRMLEEVFNFAARERLTLIRKDIDAPIEAMTRQNFNELAESPLLRRAFAEHKRRGGQLTESDVFDAMLQKPRNNGLKPT
ncbi:MAG: ankyrin repeat domain-containing protein [Micavibrio sp.]|nr:ankyrin repeat domain-containing protein [Micavibrio sp.]